MHLCRGRLILVKDLRLKKRKKKKSINKGFLNFILACQSRIPHEASPT